MLLLNDTIPLNLSITDGDKHGQKLCPEPVPSCILKDTKVNLFISSEECSANRITEVNQNSSEL